MKLMKAVLSGICLTLIVLFGANLLAQDAGQTPDTAFDPINNRYLMVWSDGATVMGKFVGPDGSELAAPEVLSPDRPTQGCFYGNFDSDNGAISTPTSCAENLNPTVAYNNGQYIIAWEVRGQAGSPSSSPENQFVNIFARIVDATNLTPLAGWEEGILISKVFIAANNADDCGNGKFACNDSEIQAWSQSQNPHVAPRVGGSGFVVTWQTNKDYIGCANAERRGGISIYGRYIDQNFSATSSTNPPMFAIFKDDSTIEASCAPLDNVDNGRNPRIAANQSSNDLVVVYEVARANGGSASIGAKKITVDSDGQGVVSGSMMADVVASVDGSSLINPDVVAFKTNYVLFAEDSDHQIRAKSFSSDGISNDTPAVIDLGGGEQAQPRVGSNLGDGGQGPTTGMAPEVMLLTYRQDANVSGVLLSEGLNIVGSIIPVSAGISTQNTNAEISSNKENLLVVWQGESDGLKVFSKVIEPVIPTGEPPTAPVLQTPNDGVTFAPIRAYLSWDASTDPDGDDGAITYNVYFGENTLPGTPQATGLTTTDFVVGPENQSMTGITLLANKTYVWAIEARDEDGNTTLSSQRSLSTDDSVVGWWRFDEDPTGSVCSGGTAGETVCDSSGNNNHGIPFGNPVWVSPGMPDVLLGALEFDGTNDWVEVANSSSINPDSMSIVARFMPNGITGEQTILDKRIPGGPAAYNLRILGGAFPLELVWNVTDINGVENFNSDAGAINDGVYSQTISTYNSTSGDSRLYLDGFNLGTVNFGILNRSVKSNSSLLIGDSTFGTQPTMFNFNGTIDEIIVLNRDVGNVEALNIYDSSN